MDMVQELPQYQTLKNQVRLAELRCILPWARQTENYINSHEAQLKQITSEETIQNARTATRKLQDGCLKFFSQKLEILDLSLLLQTMDIHTAIAPLTDALVAHEMVEFGPCPKGILPQTIMAREAWQSKERNIKHKYEPPYLGTSSHVFGYWRKDTTVPYEQQFVEEIKTIMQQAGITGENDMARAVSHFSINSEAMWRRRAQCQDQGIPLQLSDFSIADFSSGDWAKEVKKMREEVLTNIDKLSSQWIDNSKNREFAEKLFKKFDQQKSIWDPMPHVDDDNLHLRILRDKMKEREENKKK